MNEASVKKVLVVDESPEFGGVEINIRTILKHLAAPGLELLLLCHKRSSFPKIFKDDPRIISFNLPKFYLSKIKIGRRTVTNPFAVVCNSFILLYYLTLVAAICRRRKIDTIFSTTDPAHFYCGIASRIRGCRSVWHFQDIISTEQCFGLLNRLVRVFMKYFSDRVICVSNAVKDNLGGESPKLVVINNPHRFLREGWGVEDRSRILEENGLAELRGKTIIGMVCRLVRWKGVHVLVQAAPEILKKFPDACFLVVGDSEYESHKNEIRDLIAGLGLLDRFILFGFTEKPFELIGCFDICVHASVTPEPFGLSVLDYMLLAKPIVACYEGGVKDILDESTAVLVTPGSVEEMARGVASLLADREKMLALGTNARKRVLSTFGPEKFIKALERELLSS